MDSVTLKDVARLAGVHPSTVSRALDPSKNALVNPETRTRVMAAAQELGYRHDILAAGLRRRRSSTIGVVVSDLGNPFITPVIRGIANAVEEKGWMVLATETGEHPDRLRRALEHLHSRRADAVIVSAIRLPHVAIVQEVARRGIPVVLAVRYVANSGLPTVRNDDYAGATMATEHLAELGHRRVAQLHGPPDIQTFADRGFGFRDTAKRFGMEAMPLDDAAESPVVEEGRRLMSRLLVEQAEHPSAVFAHNDLMAVGAIEALEEVGLRCPEDVSIIGYNDAPLTSHISPPLSTIRLPSAEIGRFAGQLALDLIDNPDHPATHIVLQPTLVPRASTMALVR